jgi:hypothetical protein
MCALSTKEDDSPARHPVLNDTTLSSRRNAAAAVDY